MEWKSIDYLKTLETLLKYPKRGKQGEVLIMSQEREILERNGIALEVELEGRMGG